MNQLLHIAKLGKEMRDAQKEYFKTRSGESLNRAKDYERKFDSHIKKVLQDQGQSSMFT